MSHGLIIANHLTDERGCDGTIGPTLIVQTGHIDSIVADQGYGQDGGYEAELCCINKATQKNLNIPASCFYILQEKPVKTVALSCFELRLYITLVLLLRNNLHCKDIDMHRP